MPDLGNSLADYDFYRNDRVKAAALEKSKEPEPSLLEGIKAAYRTEWTLKSIIDNQTFQPDPNDTLTKEELKDLTKDIPDEYHHVFVKGVSKAHREQIRADLLQELSDTETLDRMGYTGAGLRFGAAATDPVQLVASSITGGLGAFGKASRLSRFIEGGLVAGGTNMAVEAYLNENQYTRDPNDIAVAGLLGFSIGGLAGVFSKGDERAVRDAANRGIRALDLDGVRYTGKPHGVFLTPEGEKALAGTTLHTGEALDGAPKMPTQEGVPGATTKYTDDDLAKVGLDSNRSKENLGLAAESVDTNGATLSEMKALKNTDFGDTPNILAARQAINEAFGADIAGGLEGRGRMKLVDSQEDLPASVKDVRGTNAFYDPMTDTTFVLADRLNKDNARGILLHDVGVHQGLERVVGTDIYQKMIDEVDRLAKEGDKAAQSALERASKSSTKDFVKAEEKLAYYLEHVGDKAQGVFREALAKIKAFLIKHFGADINLTQADLIAIVQGSLRRVAKDDNFGSHNGLFPYVWHGGPVKNIDRLSTDFVGTGEGNVFQGWGIYAGSNKATGNVYREKESMLRGMGPQDGGLYQVKVNGVTPDHFMNWDSTAQSKIVQAALKKAGIEFEGKTGKEIYFDLMSKMDGATAGEKAKAASQYLDSIGVHGNAYEDGLSRGKANPSNNYVFFNDKHLDITQRFSVGDIPVGAKSVGEGTIEKSDFLEFTIPGTDIKIPLRFDLFSIIQRSDVPVLRDIGKLLFADSVGGYKMGNTAAELAEMDFRAFHGRWLAHNEESYKNWLLDNPTPLLNRQTAWLKYNEEIAAYKRGVPGEYHESVKAAAAKANELMTELVELAKKHGVQGAEDVEATLNYVTRRFDHDNIAVTLRDLEAKLGSNQAAIEAVEKMIAGAIKSVRDVDDMKANTIARAYFKTVRNLRYDPMLNRAAMGDKEFALLRASLKELDLADGDLEEVMAMVTGKAREASGSDSGNMPRFKFRTPLDETFSMEVAPGMKLSMTDLFDNNMDSLMSLYIKQMTGAVAMAKMGFKSHADFDAMLRQARNFAADNQGTINSERALSHIKYVDDGYKQILGIPTDATMGTSFTRSMKVIRDLNFFRIMGQAGFAQAAEVGNVLGQVGFKAFGQHVPALNDLIEMAKGGRIDDALADDIMTLWGVGSEMLHSPHMKELDNLTHSKALAAAENVAETAKWITARASGLSSVNNILHQMTYRMVVQKMLNQANDMGKLSPGQLKRLATAGLGGDELKNVFSRLKEFGKVDEFGKITQIDHEAWAKVDPDGFEKFRLSVFREARRAVQEHAVGETHPWMHTMLGQIVFQFRSFMMVSHTKQFLYGLSHADSQTLGMWGFSSLFAGMAYTVQNGLNYAGDEEQLAKRLSPEAIGKAAFSRAGFSALMPMGVDTVTHFTSYEPFFSGSRSSGLESAITNPTFDFGRKFQNTLSNIGRSVFDSEYMATQQDVKDGLQLVLPNYLLLRNFINGAASDFPKHNPMKQPVGD